MNLKLAKRIRKTVRLQKGADPRQVTYVQRNPARPGTQEASAGCGRHLYKQLKKACRDVNKS